MATSPPAFAARVVRWQKRHGRHDLPWQGTRDAYRIWLSEIMLQQTQVATVIPYYSRFLERFPTLQALAGASLDDVLSLWSGLGYYSRARNLHRAAQRIIAQHGGRFPCTHADIAALPGIGRSTAAAIRVFAYGASEPILDGNVKRVLARAFAVQGWPGSAKVQDALWRIAETHLPARHIEAYTQGLMDLGATVCVRGTPRCAACPLQTVCIAFQQDRVDCLPSPRPRRELPQRRTRMLVLMRKGEVMLEKRVASGIWGGLWSLPEAALEDGARDTGIAALCQARYGARIEGPRALPVLRHGFTHFKLDIEPWRCEVRGGKPAVSATITWLPLAQALRAGIPAPVRRILTAL